MERVVNKLIKNNKSISVMESCTGGLICNSITNVDNSSKVFSFGAVTYSNEYKIKLGVDPKIIDKYSVYSEETVKEMAKCIVNYTNSNYGIGITGKLKKSDENNMYGKDDIVYYAIYDRENNKYYCNKIKVKYEKRIENKEQVLNEIINKLLEII